LRETTNKYDLIFIDPPYKTDYIKEALILIEKNDLLNIDGLVILESSSKDKFVYSEYYTIYKERKYGDKFILILNKTK
jgi:16S rRNA (guanine966-N2)-methyltransferase